MDEIHTPDKSVLLAQIHAAHARLEALLDSLTEAEMIQVQVQNGWTVKDILAHLATWERLTTARLHAAYTGRPLNFAPPREAADVDRINARIYAENKDRSLAAVLSEFHAAHQELIEAIETLPWTFIAGKLHTDWGRDRPVLVLISANTLWHYAEHAEEIQKWLEKRG